MSEQLTPEELAQIVREIEIMRSRTENELTTEEVKSILRELNLSPEFLDDALMQLRRKQALKEQNQRYQKIAIGIVVSSLIAISLAVFFWQQQHKAIALVRVQGDRLTLESDRGDNVRVIERQNSPTVVYQVVLKDAPIGKRLDLLCNWVNPDGEIVKQNRYQTRNITTSVWNTRCRHLFGSASPAGDWQVQMFLSGRQLSKTDFEVK